MVRLFALLIMFIFMVACEKDDGLIDSVREGSLQYKLVSTTGSSKYGNLLVVECLDEHKQWQRFYESDFLDLKPWKLELADIDGDGQKEILIAVVKTTHFDDKEKNRMFIFNFFEERLVKKWTGSQIAGTWDQFYVGDLLQRIQGEEIIFVEQVEDQGERLHIYYWFDFGFILLASSEIYQEILDISIIGENHMIITTKEGLFKRKRSIMVKDGEIIEIEP